MENSIELCCYDDSLHLDPLFEELEDKLTEYRGRQPELVQILIEAGAVAASRIATRKMGEVILPITTLVLASGS